MPISPGFRYWFPVSETHKTEPGKRTTIVWTCVLETTEIDTGNESQIMIVIVLAHSTQGTQLNHCRLCFRFFHQFLLSLLKNKKMIFLLHSSDFLSKLSFSSTLFERLICKAWELHHKHHIEAKWLFHTLFCLIGAYVFFLSLTLHRLTFSFSCFTKLLENNIQSIIVAVFQLLLYRLSLKCSQTLSQPLFQHLANNACLLLLVEISLIKSVV